jgi:hypothetical protein
MAIPGGVGNGLDRPRVSKACWLKARDGLMGARAAFVVFLLGCGFVSFAAAADATFDQPDAKNALHGVNGRTYWEMFAVCFTSANAVLEKAALDKDETAQSEFGALASAVLERGIARLVTDRAVFEGEAEEVFLARAAQFSPAAEFADACKLYIRDHDARFGPPK